MALGLEATEATGNMKPLLLLLLHGTANYVAADQVASGNTEMENKLAPQPSPCALCLGQVSLNNRAASIAFYPSKSSNEKGCKFAVVASVAAAAAVVCDNVAEPTGQRADGRIKG